MKIKVIRTWLGTETTTSNVEVDGELVCYGLEDAVREVPGKPVAEWKIPGKTAIPYGNYALKMTYSNRFKRDMLQVMGVPGFEGIRIHAGNTAEDTEGCLLVGTTMGQDSVGNSRLALLNLSRLVQYALANKEQVAIEFTNAKGSTS